MAVRVIRSPSGMGKTTTMAQRIGHANKDWRIEVYVPTHALAVEWRDLIKKANLWRSRKLTHLCSLELTH